MSTTFDQAMRYLNSIDLTGTKRGILSQDAAADAGEVFDKAKNQAQVIGSALFSFTQGVDTDIRQAISDSALLAQLVANLKASATSSPIDWFNHYSEVLQNVGWTLQDSGWTDYSAKGDAAEVNEQIIQVLTIALGPAPAALALVTSAVNALKAMSPSSPWLTIFNRESQKANIARFQIGLVDQSATADVFVSLLGCLIQARNDITQVLFFRFRNADATFRANAGKASINRAVLKNVIPAIEGKIQDYQTGYLSTILSV